MVHSNIFTILYSTQKDRPLIQNCFDDYCLLLVLDEEFNYYLLKQSQELLKKENSPVLTTKYSAIIFDLDGTLYNMDRLGIRMALRFLTSFHYLKASRKTLRDLSGKHFDNKDVFFEKYYRSTADLLNVSITNAKQWEKKFYKTFISILKKHYSARPNIQELISELNVPCAVLSDYGMIDERLKALGIEPELFKVRLYSGDLGGLKPNPAVFIRAAEILDIKPEKILVLGDNMEKDGIGAEGAGMDFFHIDDETWPLTKQRFFSGS